MKKNIAAILSYAAYTVLLFTVLVPNADAQILTQSPLTFHKIATELSTPEAIGRYLWKNFVYESDQSNFGKEEYWQTPEEFIANGKGDCEDFALFAAELLKNTGKQAFVLNIYGRKFAHTVCVYLDNGRYNVIDGTDVKKYEADDLSSLMSKIHPHWNKGAIVAISSETHKGRIVKHITK